MSNMSGENLESIDDNAAAAMDAAREDGVYEEEHIDYFRTNHITQDYTSGVIYQEDTLYQMLFLGANWVNQPAYILTDAASRESLPYVEKEMLKNAMVSDAILIDLGHLGKQIGKTIRFGEGENDMGRILQFIKEETSLGLPSDLYRIIDNQNKIQDVPGVILMEQNPELYLEGNLITEMTVKTAERLEKRRHILKRVRGMIGDYKQVFKGRLKAEAVMTEFTAAEMANDPILKEESLVINNLANEYIGVPTKDAGVKSRALDGYAKNEDFVAATKDTRVVMIPSFTATISEGTIAPKAVGAIKSAIAKIFNDIEVGGKDVAVFYGMQSVSGTTPSTFNDGEIIGGNNILMDVLHTISPSFESRVNNARQYKGFRVKIENVPGTARMKKISIFKTKNVAIVPLDGEQTLAEIKDDAVINMPNASKKRQASLHLMTNNILSIPYKEVMVDNKAYFALNSETDNMTAFLGVDVGTIDEKILRVVPQAEGKVEGSDSSGNDVVYHMPAKEFVETMEKIKNSKNAITNKIC